MSYRPLLFRAKELENTSVATVDSYIEALEMSNLIYLARPMDYFRKAFAIPAIAFLYLLGKVEADGQNGKM